MNRSSFSELPRYLSPFSSVLVIGKGPASLGYRRHIDEGTLTIGINEMVLLPEIKLGFIVDYEPIIFVSSMQCTDCTDKLLLLAKFPCKRVSELVSIPISTPVSKEGFFRILETRFRKVVVFENRFNRGGADYTPNLVSVTALLKILRSLGVTSVRTVGIGAASGYAPNANRNFKTQLTSGYGRQIPLLFKISKKLGLELTRHEGDELCIILKNHGSRLRYDIYKSFIKNVLMLRNAKIESDWPKIELLSPIVLDCQRFVPQAQYSSGVDGPFCDVGNSDAASVNEELRGFFVARELTGRFDRSFALNPKKSITASYYQAIFRAARAMHPTEKVSREIFFRMVRDERSLRTERTERRVIIRFNGLIFLGALYLWMCFLEVVENWNLAFRATRLYWIYQTLRARI